MKTMFVEARYTEKFTLSEDLLDILPKEITLATTIQFFDSLENFKHQLKQHNIQVTMFKGLHAKHPGQILGCSTNIQQDAKAFLYIGTGLFHPKALLLKNNKPVYAYNPLNKSHKLLTEKDIETIKRKHMGALLKYKMSNTIGILISTKPGQHRLNQANKLREQLKQQNKKAYIFITETLNLNELENFPFIDCWVNTACPRITEDESEKKVINIEDIY